VTAGGQAVTVDGPGLAVFVPREGAAPIGPFRISAAGLQALQALLRTVAEPGGGGGKKSHKTRNALLGVAGGVAVIGGAAILGGKKKKRPNQQPQSQPQKPRGR